MIKKKKLLSGKKVIAPKLSSTEMVRWAKDFKDIKTKDEILSKKIFLEQVRTELKVIMQEMDSEIIDRMKEEGIEEFIVLIGGMKNKIYYTSKEKDTILKPKFLEDRFFNGNLTEKALLRRAISFSASAWSVPKVREFCDTIGLDSKEMIQTTYSDKLKLEVMPVEMLKRKGVIK